MSDRSRIAYVDGPRLRRALLAAVRCKAELNRINVFPVADGDTGTNLSLTLEAVAGELAGSRERRVDRVAALVARSALLGARGNCGMMLSSGAEGTGDFADAMVAMRETARESLARTPDLLPVLSARGKAVRRLVGNHGGLGLGPSGCGGASPRDPAAIGHPVHRAQPRSPDRIGAGEPVRRLAGRRPGPQADPGSVGRWFREGVPMRPRPRWRICCGVNSPRAMGVPRSWSRPSRRSSPPIWAPAPGALRTWWRTSG